MNVKKRFLYKFYALVYFLNLPSFFPGERGKRRNLLPPRRSQRPCYRSRGENSSISSKKKLLNQGEEPFLIFGGVISYFLKVHFLMPFFESFREIQIRPETVQVQNFLSFFTFQLFCCHFSTVFDTFQLFLSLFNCF